MENKMLSITDGGSLARALNLPIDHRLKRLLARRCKQLGGDIADQARFVVVQPGDSLKAIDKKLGFSVFQNAGDGTWFGDPDFTPGWEWLEDHGHCFELVFIFDDSGFAHVVLVQNSPMQNRRLRALCLAYAK